MAARTPIVFNNSDWQQIQSGDYISIAAGGTGATSASAALTALGAYPATNPAGYVTGASILSSVLTGFSSATNAAVTASSTALQAFGYLQAQVTANAAAVVPLTLGGTGATTAAAAATNLGLGTTGTPTFASVSATTFTGALSGNASTATTAGNVSGTVAVANGGTGATTVAGALAALGLVANDTVVNSVAVATTAANTANIKYVYLVSGAAPITLPTAVGNTNVYTIKNIGTGTVVISTTGAQTIDGSLTASLIVQYTSLTIVSDGANWYII
jgi:hypothetical protein